MTSSSRNIILFFVLASLWSGSFIGIKVVVATWPPIFGAAVRVGIALMSIMILVVISGQKTKIPFTLRWKLWVIGLFAQAIPFAFLFWGERYVSSGLAGILNGTVPIWTFILSFVFIPNRTDFSLLKIFGLSLGLLGVTIIFWPLLTFKYNFNMLIGTSAILVMAMSYGMGGVLNQLCFQSTKVDFFTNLYHQHWSSFTFLAVVSLLVEKLPAVGHLTTEFSPWVACLYLGICSTALAYVIFYYLIKEWDAVRATSVLYIVPLLALIWDYLFFNYPPQSTELLGIAAILLGVLLIQWSALRQNYRRRATSSV